MQLLFGRIHLYDGRTRSTFLTSEIHLVNTGRVTIVDDEDAHLALSSLWFESRNGYAYCHKFNYLHRQIMGRNGKLVVDHINRIKLDNRRSNMRFLTHAENLTNAPLRPNNTSGYKGVIKYKSPYGRQGRWMAIGTISQKQIHIGIFDTPEEASEAYKLWAAANGRFA